MAESVKPMVHDLVNIRTVCPDICIDLLYAQPNNFLHKTFYNIDKSIAFLRRPVAQKLVGIQAELKLKGYGLKIVDAYRPISVQKEFWKALPDERFIANPYKKGSKHSRGAAVDIALVSLADGKELDMGCPVDEMSERASVAYKKLAPAVLERRSLLLTVMEKHGFVSYTLEWWHFNDKDCGKYEALDVTFDQLMAS